MSPHVSVIFIKAARVEDMGNGTYRVEMPGIPLTNDDRKFIERLYPTMSDKAYELLDKESLISAVATPAEIQAPVTDPVGQFPRPAKKAKRLIGDDAELP